MRETAIQTYLDISENMTPSRKCCILLLLMVVCTEWLLCAAFAPAGFVKQSPFDRIAQSHLRKKNNKWPRRNPVVRFESLSQKEENKPVEIDLEEILVIFIPLLTMFLAFFLYDSTAKLFHEFVVTASGRKFDFVDGGAALDNLLKPALTGPISGLVSILFSTIVATTIAKLYERNESMTQEVANILDDLQLLSLHSNFFPPVYKKNMQSSIDLFTSNFKFARLDASIDEKTRRRLVEENQLILGDLMTSLHRLNQDPDVEKNDRAVDEAYGRLNELIKRRSTLDNMYDSSFPIWHYGNICILGLGICVIFLFLTDKPALQFLGDFQLRVCWAMLLGCFSMLTVTIVDLITPLQGAYKIRLGSRLIDDNQDYLED